jgi:hypothetical protein
MIKFLRFSHYEQALQLLPVDSDIELTPAVKERIQTVSADNLKKTEVIGVKLLLRW